MAAGADKAQAAPQSPALGAIERARDLAKWLIAAFGAIGATLVAGSQLSEIGKLDGLRLAAAFAGLVLGLVGIAIAIWFAVKVLTPEHLTLKQLARDESSSAAGKLVHEDSDILLGHGDTIAELEGNRVKALARETKALASYNADRNNPNLKQEAIDAQADRRLVDDAVQQFLPIALYANVRKTLGTATKAMFVGVIVAALGIGLFAWAAHPVDKKTAAAGAAPAVAKDPSEVVVKLNKDGDRALSKTLGPTCNTAAVDAIAVGGKPDAVEVVAIPKDGCESARFTVTSEVGTVVSGEQIDTLAACPKENPKPPCIVK